jgi:hypothetical protein
MSGGSSIDVRFELGPTVEPVASGQDKLRVVEREFGSVCAAVVSLYFRRGTRIASQECSEQFLGLTLELIEIRMSAQFASGLRLFHNELLSGARCPLVRAEKSSSN